MLTDYSQGEFAFVTQWMKSSEAWDKFRNGAIISNLLIGLRTFDIQALYSTKEKLPLKENFLPIYIIGATLENISEKCKGALESFIENPETRANTLERIAYSLVAKDRVSSHSFMLRDVLKRIQALHQIDPMAAMASFSQLLVNITTCTTGKLNGITHTYLLMNKDTLLDESELGSTAFTQGIIHHFNEELRRFREGTLTAMVKAVVKGSYPDPHDIQYVRGVIGGDIGLLFANEVPRVDMNGNVVNRALRQMSKQELLDLFYQYYTVEEVIELFHTKLNNRSFKIEDLGTGKNLTIKVINEYVVANPSWKPVGLMPAAAKNLLLQMGVLIAVLQ